MGWFTTKDGRHINTDWFTKDRQINANAEEAARLNEKSKFKNGYGHTDVSEGRVENGKTNSLMEHTRNGKLDPEREKLHREIIDKYFDGKDPATGQATFYMTGGGSASGKGQFVDHPDDFMGQDKNCVVVDSDTIKKMLPEWNDNNPDSAGFLHEESSALAKRIMSLARENNYNYMLDGTGDGSFKSLTGKIADARSYGYKVVASYATVNWGNAFERNYGRYLKHGRLVPYAMVKKTHMEVAKLFPKVANQFDYVRLYNNDGKIKLIAECSRGGSIKVLDNAAYTEFINKANFTDDPKWFDEAVKKRIALLKNL